MVYTGGSGGKRSLWASVRSGTGCPMGDGALRRKPMTDAERHAALLVDLEAATRSPMYLSRQEARAYADQAGDDYEAGDRMVARMEELRTMDRDAAARWVRELPFEGDFAAFVGAALAGLGEREAKARLNGRVGVGEVAYLVRQRGEGK